MNRIAKHTVMVFFALSVAAGFAPSSQAEPRGKPSAEAHYKKGMKAYTLGHFTEAIEEFEKAYEVRSEPIFLYNIAQSHRQSDNPQRAIFFYRRYLEAEPDAKNRSEIEQRIKDMQAQLDAKAEIALTTAPPIPAPQPVAPPIPAATPVVVEPVPVIREQAQPERAQTAGRGLRIAGIGIGATGVAGVVTGIALGLHASSLYKEANTAGNPYDYAKDQSSRTFRTLEWVSFSVGGAAIATGAVLYYFGASAKSASTSVAVAPFLAPGAGGAAISGRF